MPITHIHSLLVHPSKNAEEQPQISGAKVPLSGKLYEMLRKMYEGAANECSIPIIFRSGSDGRQSNDCRNALIAYLEQPALPKARAIAGRLQMATTRRSGLGLFFVVTGLEGRTRSLLLGRFPADQGIIAEERSQDLDVQFIERVFMKSAKSYKAAYYADDSLRGGFWIGGAVDKQLNVGSRELSYYWIGGFLESELRTTSAAGTKRLAEAMREAVRIAPTLEVKTELVSATTLLRGQAGRVVSGDSLVNRMGLSQEARECLQGALPRPELMAEQFQFDRDEFDRHLLYRSVELDNGAVLLAENSSFDEVFRREAIRRGKGEVRFTTEGKIVDDKLGKRR